MNLVGLNKRLFSLEKQLSDMSDLMRESDKHYMDTLVRLDKAMTSMLKCQEESDGKFTTWLDKSGKMVTQAEFTAFLKEYKEDDEALTKKLIAFEHKVDALALVANTALKDSQLLKDKLTALDTRLTNSLSKFAPVPNSASEPFEEVAKLARDLRALQTTVRQHDTSISDLQHNVGEVLGQDKEEECRALRSPKQLQRYLFPDEATGDRPVDGFLETADGALVPSVAIRPGSGGWREGRERHGQGPPPAPKKSKK